jgi:hypothetical protein
MMTQNMIDNMLKRPARQSIDGLNEIQFGVVFLLWGGIGIALELRGSGLPEWVRWFGLALPLVTAFVTKAIIQKLRARWVYPRIGYVKWAPPILGRPVMAMILGGIVTFFTIVALTQSSQFKSSLPVFMGILFAAGNFAWWTWLRIRRLLVYTVLALASGLVVGMILPSWLGCNVFMSFVSVFYLVGGFFAVRHLMRKPMTSAEQQ